jgi:hypothetical protein
MIRGLTGLLRAAAERRLRDFLLGVVVAAMVALFAADSLGLGTLRAFPLHVRLGAASGITSGTV